MAEVAAAREVALDDQRSETSAKQLAAFEEELDARLAEQQASHDAELDRFTAKLEAAAASSATSTATAADGSEGAAGRKAEPMTVVIIGAAPGPKFATLSPPVARTGTWPRPRCSAAAAKPAAAISKDLA